MSYSYSKVYKMNIVGLRFYSIWSFGRPDMTPFNFINNYYKNLKIKILVMENIKEILLI